MSYHLVFFSKISRNFNSTFIQIVNNLESPLLLYIKLPSLAQYVYTKNTLNWCTNLNFNHFIYCQILIFSYLQSLPCTPPLLLWFFARMHTLTPSVRLTLFPTPALIRTCRCDRCRLYIIAGCSLVIKYWSTPWRLFVIYHLKKFLCKRFNSASNFGNNSSSLLQALWCKFISTNMQRNKIQGW